MSQFIEMFGDNNTVSLCDVAHITMGSSPDSEYYNENGEGLPFYQGKTEFGDMYIKPAVIFCTEPVREADVNDILMSVRAPVGAVNIAQEHCCIGRGLAAIRAKSEKMTPLFLYYALKIKEDNIAALGTGSTFKAINKDVVYSIQIPASTMDEQQKFVAIAQQADKSKFVGFKSQFIEMFEGDKYPSVRLSDIASEWLKGQSFRKDDIVDNGNSMCIHYGELFTKYGPIINQVLSRTNVEGKRTSKVGDILFPASDVTPNGLARCSMLPYDNIILGGDIIVLRPKRDCNAAYLSYAINQQTAQLLIRVNGAVVKHMSAKALMTVVIPMPPLEEQNRFVSLAQQADKSKFELRQAIEKIDKVMKSLLQ